MDGAESIGETPETSTILRKFKLTVPINAGLTVDPILESIKPHASSTQLVGNQLYCFQTERPSSDNHRHLDRSADNGLETSLVPNHRPERFSSDVTKISRTFKVLFPSRKDLLKNKLLCRFST